MNQMPKPGMIVANLTFGTIYIILNVKLNETKEYYILNVLSGSNRIYNDFVPIARILEFDKFNNWKLV